jgi:hypothetical protein
MKKTTTQAPKQFIFKSADTGKIVTKQFAVTHPKTTFKERIIKKK